jgi:hypothetical protein
MTGLPESCPGVGGAPFRRVCLTAGGGSDMLLSQPANLDWHR